MTAQFVIENAVENQMNEFVILTFEEEKMSKQHKYGKGAISDVFAVILLAIRNIASGRNLESEMKRDLTTALIKVGLAVAMLSALIRACT